MNTRLARAVACLALLLLLAPSSARAAAPPQDDDARFEQVLRAIHGMPPSRAAFEAAFADAKDRVLAAARQADRDEYTRTRAISFLSFFPDPDVRDALLVLADATTPFVRRMALYTVARSFGATAGTALVARVEAAATDVDAEVRDRAVRALRWIDHPAAGQALRRLAAKSAYAPVRKLAAQIDARRTRRISR